MTARIASRLLHIPWPRISATTQLRSLNRPLFSKNQQLQWNTSRWLQTGRSLYQQTQQTPPPTSTTTEATSSAADTQQKSASVETHSKLDEFTEFFFFPHIRLTHLLVRMKLYQTGLVVLPSPYVLKLLNEGAITTAGACTWGAFAGMSVAAFAILTIYARGFIGRLSLSEDCQIVEISSLDFWGNRVDERVEVDSMIPFVELKGSPTDLLIKLERYDKDKHYYICLRNGGVKDVKRFEHVFGKFY